MNKLHTPMAKAEAYVIASNNHDLGEIASMLAEDCRYVSSGVGEHNGKEAILTMMEAFFSANPNVHWTVPEYRLDAANRAVFDFTISLGERSSQGTEKISFDEDGNITMIEVIR